MPIGKPGTKGLTPLQSNDEFAIYVIDEKRWLSDRYQPFITDYHSPIYAISRETLHLFFGVPAKNYSLDLKTLFSGS